MSKNEWKPGDRGYTDAGFEVEYVGCRADGALVVSELHDTEYGERYSELYSVQMLHRAAPTEKLDAKIAQKRELLKAAEEELQTKRATLSEHQAKCEEIRKAAERHEELRLLLDYLDGKITHVVIIENDSVPKIAPLADILTGKDPWDRWQRAIGLFAAPNSAEATDHRYKRVSWKANRYADGSSSSWTEFIPCYSEEQAREIVAGLMSTAIDEWRKTAKPKHWLSKASDDPWMGKLLPDDWKQHQANLRLEIAQKARDYAAAALEAAETKVREAIDAANNKTKETR